MSDSDPMIFAARVANMSDNQLFNAFRMLTPESMPSDFQQAVLDEAQFRGILTHSEASAILGVRTV